MQTPKDLRKNLVSQRKIVSLQTNKQNMDNLRTPPTIIARDGRSVTVRMSNSRWKRYQELEESYVVASHVLKGLTEVKSLKPMTIEEAEAELDLL